MNCSVNLRDFEVRSCLHIHVFEVRNRLQIHVSDLIISIQVPLKDFNDGVICMQHEDELLN